MRENNLKNKICNNEGKNEIKNIEREIQEEEIEQCEARSVCFDGKLRHSCQGWQCDTVA